MKRVVSLCLVFAMVLAIAAPVLAASFADTKGHWAENYIEKSTKEKIINGYADGTFKPNAPITRAGFVTLVYKMFEPSSKADLSTYKDVPAKAWYRDALAGAISMGIFNGDSTTKARPNDYITREEAIVMLNRILGYKVTEDVELELTDLDEVSSWAKDDVLAFIEQGYINGYKDNTFRPKNNITRAEAVKIINKAIGLIITKAGEYDLKDVEGDVIVKADGVTLTNAEGKKVFVPTPEIKADIKAKDVPAEDVIVISEVEETVKETGSSGRGGSSSSTKTDKVTVILVPTNDIYEIIKSGDKEIKEGVSVTVVVSGEKDQTEIVKNLVVRKSSLATFKSKAKAAFTNGVLDEQRVIKTLNDVYGEEELVRAWGKKTATSNKLSEEEAQIVEAYLAALSPEERAVILDLYNELGLENPNKVATVAIDELTYEEALELIKIVNFAN